VKNYNEEIEVLEVKLSSANADKEVYAQNAAKLQRRVDDFVRAVDELLSNAIDADGSGEIVVQRIDVDDLRNLLKPTKEAASHEE
jgi:anti-sigma regulatory factor (Ser/Thr protein kinase)